MSYKFDRCRVARDAACYGPVRLIARRDAAQQWHIGVAAHRSRTASWRWSATSVASQRAPRPPLCAARSQPWVLAASVPVAHSYATTMAAPTVQAQPLSAPAAPKKSIYPPILIECLPNYVHHLGRISQLLGRPANARAYGKGYRISPDAEEYRVVQRYLLDLEKEDRRIS
ncbi:unnamed protein product [Pieris macdunnoughi]|uniref:Uncharacterized protein n=1 Tax=Pieris macdunnoughi TaxID=345717 RepID=A0A821UGG3_9NEOP|nr:unnamed protein product [Pieris macdunnoughi]